VALTSQLSNCPGNSRGSCVWIPEDPLLKPGGLDIIGGGLTVVQVKGNRRESLRSDAFCHFAGVRDHPIPLVQDNDGATTVGNEISAKIAKADVLTHAHLLAEVPRRHAEGKPASRRYPKSVASRDPASPLSRWWRDANKR
jgi:hypothetical protein